MSLRKRIEKSEFLAALIARVAGGYLAFCNRTTSWQVEGLDDLKAALDEGPILLVMWHSRSVMGALHWPVVDGPLSSLYDKSPIGRVSGALQRRVGLQPMEMSRKLSNRAASRTVLQRVKDGVSIGMTGDGPLGPALQVKDAPLEWARATGLPIFCYAFSTSRSRRLSSWDQMMVPKSFGKGAYVFQRAQEPASRKMTNDEIETLRTSLQQALTDTAHRADALAGVAPGA
ncbi:lysophospholipid acyltransferase family protein [Loktanella sp. Alg231-35]|uniref:lysophospholipid acyltransferase family protein n=1 Tax=Loktanella sp. Alg231-35 TaxID=1922220 RepID=UPI000D55763B|nr:DUF374 domain-containing protein [Loktanella sp. Alg231-35]